MGSGKSFLVRGARLAAACASLSIACGGGGHATHDANADAATGGAGAGTGGSASMGSGGKAAGGSASSGSGGKGSGGAATGSGGAGAEDAGSCGTDPLRTGDTPPDGSDAFDCDILASTKKYGEPDAMIFKAIIHTESRFAVDAVACPNLPCGTPAGWTQAESYCYGLMQIVPACLGANKEGLLSNGHPNLTTASTSPEWATSTYNPAINIDVGVYGISDNRKQEKQKFSGCTEDEYTLMAIGDYNSYGSTKSCTVYNTTYDDAVLTTYTLYSQQSGWAAHPYPN